MLHTAGDLLRHGGLLGSIRWTPLEFTRYLTKEIGVACIPPETFYSQEHTYIGQGYVRFAFCKSDELLEQVKERFIKLRN